MGNNYEIMKDCSFECNYVRWKAPLSAYRQRGLLLVASFYSRVREEQRPLGTKSEPMLMHTSHALHPQPKRSPGQKERSRSKCSIQGLSF